MTTCTFKIIRFHKNGDGYRGGKREVVATHLTLDQAEEWIRKQTPGETEEEIDEQIAALPYLDAYSLE